MATPQRPSERFDRSQMSAILRRAIELTGDETPLTTTDLAEVAEEIGVPPDALAAAVAESKAGLDRRTRLIDRLIGPARVGANVAVDDAEAATDNLRRWLEVEQGLQASVDRNGVVVATKRGGVSGALGTGVRRLQGSGGLDRARSVRAAAAAVDESGAACVVADVSNKRAEAMAGGTVVAGASVVAIGVVAFSAGPLVLITLPVAALAGLGTARVAHQRTVTTVAHQVEGTVAAVGRDEGPIHPVQRLLRSGRSRRRDRPPSGTS